MAIALVALFVALGGSAVAASKLARNSVGSTQIKNGSVTGADVKNRSITGADVKDGSLTGADVDESKLGLVPGAQNAVKAVAADTATTAGSATTAATAARAGDADKLGGRAASGFVTTDQVELVQKRFTEAGSDTLVERGSLKITARCYDNETVNGVPGQDGVELIISTSKDGAMFSSDEGTSRTGGAADTDYLNTDTAEADRTLLRFTRADAADARLFTPIDEFVAVDADGVGFTTGGMESFALALDVAGAKCSVAFPVTKVQL